MEEVAHRLGRPYTLGIRGLPEIWVKVNTENWTITWSLGPRVYVLRFTKSTDFQIQDWNELPAWIRVISQQACMRPIGSLGLLFQHQALWGFGEFVFEPHSDCTKAMRSRCSLPRP